MPISAADQELDGHERIEAQRRRAREALVQSCLASGVPAGPFAKDTRNVPLPFGGTYWSISHKPQYVAAVVSSSPVGIDLEEVTPRKRRLFGYIAEDSEWALAEQNWDTFFRFWTAKEAVLKATGAGLKDLKKTRIQTILDGDRLIVVYAQHPWPVQHYRFGNHLVSLTHSGEIRWTLA